MRRILYFIALAILTLTGPAEVVRTFAGVANVACQCGCGAPSEDACDCSAMPMHRGPAPRPSSNAPSGSPCSSSASHSGAVASTASPAGVVDEKQKEDAGSGEKRIEPKPWTLAVARIADLCAHTQPRETIWAEGLRPLDRLAWLATFRI